ncbi:hypothetical protein Droror1_Dr00018011 [Drosera rotundifolia]
MLQAAAGGVLGGNSSEAVSMDGKNHQQSYGKSPPKVSEIVDSKKGIFAADDAQCSKVGASTLKKGGHAVDAAVATALCLDVVSPISSGVGGGSLMILYSPSTGKATTFDSREILQQLLLRCLIHTC